MCTMQTFSKLATFSIMTFLLSVNTAWAQQRIDWPRTFSGQPDFDFVRDDVIIEREEKARNGEDILSVPTTWEIILKTEEFDPLAPHRPDAATTEQSFVGIDIPSFDSASLDSSNFDNNELPTLNQENKIDVSEFKAFLENVISRAVKTAPPHFEELNIQKELARIVVQTIATSPAKYTMINGRRYTEGSTLSLPVYLLVRTEDVVNAVDQNMPKTAQLGSVIQKTYKDIRDDVLKEFKNNRTKRPNSYKAKHMLQVTVDKITPRSVVVVILGNTYELVLR